MSLDGSNAARDVSLLAWLQDHWPAGVVETELPLPDGIGSQRLVVMYGAAAELQVLQQELLAVYPAAKPQLGDIEPVAQGWDAAYADPGAGHVFADQFWLGVAPPSTGDLTWIRLPEQVDSFGRGDHAATQVQLAWLAQHGVLIKGQAVLDVGCGCGTLVVAAAFLGATVAVGTEIDSQALADAHRLQQLNEPTLGERVRFRQTPDPTSLAMSFRVVLCNIRLAGQLALAPAVTAVCAPDGAIHLSGFTSADQSEVLAAYQNHGWELQATSSVRGWCGLHLSARSN